MSWLASGGRCRHCSRSLGFFHPAIEPAAALIASVVLVASVTALIVVLVRLVFGRKITADERIPFGPYLCLATWLIWLYGPLVL